MSIRNQPRGFWVGVALLICSLGFAQQTHSQTATSVTYQGFRREGGLPANGAYDFLFRLFDNATGDTQVGANTFANDLNVVNYEKMVL